MLPLLSFPALKSGDEGFGFGWEAALACPEGGRGEEDGGWEEEEKERERKTLN